MRNLTDVSQFPLKVIFAVHLWLVTWAIQGWYSQSMLFYNTLYFICILWAVHNTESDEPIQFALFISITSEFFDFIHLSVNSPFSGSAFQKFSASMIIINMIIRVITSFYLLRLGQARGGNLSIMITSPAMGLGHQEYENISHAVPQNSDFTNI
ncbi:PREDICTED: uncharacterized protein LOC105366660 [Ceratosolen solmsi marchali]|uniref:Uncharacterized protein LOC105366660 n=1 Tax=Ceratosolen solmsi marchali TaxID=326594 RepID=A0AAJ6YSK9_9HYME|nr:PREDICTED: uncharacterized protein LOC105366660 [Ceratosolen solmsi marchali]